MMRAERGGAAVSTSGGRRRATPAERRANGTVASARRAGVPHPPHSSEHKCVISAIPVRVFAPENPLMSA